MSTEANPAIIERDTQSVWLPSRIRSLGGAIASINDVYKTQLFNLRLKKKLSRALSNNCIVGRHKITIEVNNGIIRLQGYVDTPGEKRIINDIVSLVGGFKKVYNEINVRTFALKNDAKITGAILYDFSSYLGLDLSKIAVQVKNGTVYLTGWVPTAHIKYTAEELVFGIPQVTCTVNELRVA